MLVGLLSLDFSLISLSLKDAKINQDVESWDYKQFDVAELSVNWASRPCTKYTRAKTTGVQRTRYANSIVLKNPRNHSPFQHQSGG